MAEAAVGGTGAQRGAALDLKRAAFDPDAVPGAALYFNQASPSAYVRGNTRAVPLALSLMRSLEIGGARVLNGTRAYQLELSKSTQAALLRKLEIPHPRTLVFNDPETALAQWTGGWPALLKPEQGGSGARTHARPAIVPVPAPSACRRSPGGNPGHLARGRTQFSLHWGRFRGKHRV
ncbi:MAG TPA: hypothetical protein VIY49_09865 [Bryobacteraceae bacterium]